jgi:hypothetical protein
MKATVFGAGNIGRGLVGLVLWRAGYEVTYVDADVAHVARLNSAGEFAVVPPSGETTVVPVYRALVADDLKSVVAGTLPSMDPSEAALVSQRSLWTASCLQNQETSTSELSPPSSS